MKQFNVEKINKDPIKVEIIGKDGESRILTSRPLTNKESSRVMELARSKDSNIFEDLLEQITIIFGEEKEFYQDLPNDLLVDILNYYIEETNNRKNPTQAKKRESE